MNFYYLCFDTSNTNLSNFRLEVKQLNCMEGERTDSMTTNYDQTEFEDMEQSNLPINHCTPRFTSVMLMNSYLDFLYAKALHVLEVKYTVIKNNCYGCMIDHPSQNQHDCIVSDLIQEHSIALYFDDMLLVVDEKKILLAWEEIVQGLKISQEVIDLYKQVLSSRDFLAVMKTEQWKKNTK